MNQAEAGKLDDRQAVNGLLQPDSPGGAYDQCLLVEEAGAVQGVRKTIQKVFHNGRNIHGIHG